MATAQNENINTESNKGSLPLEGLNMTYKTTLIEYKKAVSDYIAALNSDSSYNYNIDETPFSTIKGSTYWGTINLSQTSTSKLQECKALCSKTKGCTGATYNSSDSKKPNCMLRGGDSELSVGTDADTAIVQKQKLLLLKIKKLNQELLDTTTKIQKLTTKEEKLNVKLEHKLSDNTQDLLKQYDELMQEKDKITEMMNEYQGLDQEQTQGDLKLTSNYYSFILLLFLAIGVMIILYKIGFSSGVGTSSVPNVAPSAVVPSVAPSAVSTMVLPVSPLSGGSFFKKIKNWY